MVTKGMTSVSMLEEVASGYATGDIGNGPEFPGVMLKISSKNGVLIENLSRGKADREALFASGTKMRLTGTTKDSSGTWVLSLEEE